MTSRRLSSRMQKAVHNVRSTMQNVLTGGVGEKSTQFGEEVLKKRQRLEREGENLVHSGVCLSLKEFLGAIQSRETGLSVRN